MRLIAVAVAMMTATICSMPACADPVTVETARGPVTLPAAPARIAAYDIAAIDTLSALGVPVAGVPDKTYVPYLGAVAAQATPVGTLFDPDYEALAALSPDAIIVAGRSAAQAETLSKLAPVLDMTVSEDVLADGRKRLETYARLFGREDRAAALEAALDARIAEVRGKARHGETALILLLNGPKMAAYGVGSRFGWLHSVTGLGEAHPGLSTGFQGSPVSFEFVAEANPDWIFVVDRGSVVGADNAAPRATLDNPLVAATKAGRNGHIVYLDTATIYIASGGYTSMMSTLAELDKALSR